MTMQQAVNRCKEIVKEHPHAFFFTVAPPASGKTHFSRMLEGTVRAVHSDVIRRRLFGDTPMEFGNFSTLFGAIRMELDYELSRGAAILDSCNLTKRARSTAKSIDAEYKVAVVIHAPKEQCIRNNTLSETRDHVTPLWYINECFEKMTIPQKEEGYDEVIEIFS